MVMVTAIAHCLEGKSPGDVSLLFLNLTILIMT